MSLVGNMGKNGMKQVKGREKRRGERGEEERRERGEREEGGRTAGKKRGRRGEEQKGREGRGERGEKRGEGREEKRAISTLTRWLMACPYNSSSPVCNQLCKTEPVLNV